MATVIFECRDCDNFWTTGRGDICPQCGSKNVKAEWDEKLDIIGEDSVWFEPDKESQELEIDNIE